MPVPGLASLLRPFPTQRFLHEHWPGRHLVVHGESGRFGGLARLRAISDVTALLGAWRGNVTAVLANKDDEHSAVAVGVREATLLYRDGLNLVFNSAEEHVRELRPWLAGVTRALGLSTLAAARCIVYASPNDRGASPHFDHNANFVIQLRGTKTWRLAPNTSIAHPIDRYALNMPAVPRDVARHCDARLPLRMPRDAEEITLRPGSLLFVPRGIWHSTRASGESLSLNFTFSQPTWADLVVDSVRRRLSRDPRWRELADGTAGASRARRAAAARRLRELLVGLGDHASRLDADEVIAEVLVEAPISEASSFRRRPDVRMRVHGRHLAIHGGGTHTKIAIDPDAASFFEWIAQRTTSLTLAQMRRRAAGAVTAAAMPHLVSTLLSVGVLERH